MMIKKIKVENLYEHVLNIEGIKHPVTNPEKLNDTADYIIKKFKEFGLKVFEHKFRLKEFDFDFKNIEAFSNDDSQQEILVTSHYDTEPFTPGANDNATGIAGMLEIARVLAEENLTKNIRFVSFTLEEQSAVLVLKRREKARELGLVDEQFRYRKYNTLMNTREFIKQFYLYLAKGKLPVEAGDLAYKKVEGSLNESESKYLKFFISLYEKVDLKNWMGSTGLIGSTRWVDERIRNKKILGVLNLETIGYTSNKPYSQKYPSNLMKIFPNYKVNHLRSIGNFIAIIGDRNSRKLARTFFKNCKQKEIQLPSAKMVVPLSLEQISKLARDLLRSDHGPFWYKGIPALMLTDSANFRYPFYHTRADTIDKINFEFVKKVTQATLMTVLDYKEMIK